MNPKKKVIRLIVSAILLAATGNLMAPRVFAIRVSNQQKLTAEIGAIAKKSLIPGFSVAIVDDKRVRYSRGFGFSDLKRRTAFTPLTINWVASISKTFVALSIMKLVEQKKLRLDDQINSILPFKVVNPRFPQSAITLRQLLTHTSSITDSFETHSVGDADVVLENENDTTVVPDYIQPNVDWHRMGKKISLDENLRNFTQPGGKWFGAETFSNFEPGTQFEYSNLAVSIAGRIVEITSGVSLAEFTSKYIFKPLDMRSTSWTFDELNSKRVSLIYVQNAEKSPTGVAEYPQYYVTGYPPSGLKTDTTDLAIWVREMIRGYHGNGKLLAKESYRTLFEPQFKSGNLSRARPGELLNGGDIAIIWMISKNGDYFHLGGNIGVAAFVRFDPQRHTGSVSIANLRDADFGLIQEIVTRYEPLLGAPSRK